MRPPASPDHTSRRRWLSWTLAGVAVAALLAAALWLCVAVLPERLYPPQSDADLAGLSPADQAARREGRDKLQNDARTTLLQALAAVLVLTGAGVGAAVTLRQVRIGREQLELARKQAQQSDEHAREQLELARNQAQRSDERLREQIAVAQEGQITERFTRAVDQLGQPGPDRLDVRLGGIYALERIAHDSPTHRLAVFEILTAFIRSHSPWPPRSPGSYPADVAIEQVPSLQIRAPDVQAAITVIGRRPAQKDDPHLDLNGTDLRQANLDGAYLTWVQLNEANLAEADLSGADLAGVHLMGTNLAKAQLGEANLTGAQLYKANLTEAFGDKANLRGAQLIQTNLARAWLGEANLTWAQLGGADLTAAGLDKADLKGAGLREANLTEAELCEANLSGADLSGANLTGVKFNKANLRKAQLGEADLTGVDLSEALADWETIWPDGWDQTRRAAAGVEEADEETPREASPGSSPAG
jgi:uncharacterized protein YjbI with pentapeptide repeats